MRVRVRATMDVMGWITLHGVQVVDKQALKEFMKAGWPQDPAGDPANKLEFYEMPVEVEISWPKRWVEEVARRQRRIDLIEVQYRAKGEELAAGRPFLEIDEDEREELWDRAQKETNYFDRVDAEIDAMRDFEPWEEE